MEGVIDVAMEGDASLQKYLFRQRASLFCSDIERSISTCHMNIIRRYIFGTLT
jgi:hypothetical protein